MNYINITVRGKIARAEGRARVVCGNSDYAVCFDFDAEWAEYAVKTARFVSEDGSYTDVQFEGDTCTIPILRNTRTLLVGVFAGNLRTTTAALIHAVPCITDPDGTPADPTPDVYAQLMERFNAMEAPAAVLYTAQELTDEQKATARENIGVATPDWNQKDETASDYIKNRPFYEVTTDTLFDLTIENWRRLVIGLGTNVCSWRVAGVDYIDVMPTSQEGGAVQLYELGNVTVVVLSGQSRIYSTPSDADVHLLMRKSVVKQIDPKFIPANRFTVTVTENGNGGFTADKTIAEIIEAYEAEKDVVASFAGQELPLHMISNGNTAVFDLSTLGDTSQGLTIGRAGVNLTNKLIIPNINPVEKTSAMTNPVGVDIDGKLWSKADTSLGMTTATVGQIAKITAVDDSGKPTAWEAVDMASGGVGEWELVSNTTIAEPVSEITASIPQGKTELLMFARGKYGTSPSNKRVGFKVNGMWRLSGYTIASSWQYFKMRFMLLPNGMAWIEQQENNMPHGGTCTIGLDCDNNAGIYEPSNYGATEINKVSFSMIGTDGTLDTGFQFIVFAR